MVGAADKITSIIQESLADSPSIKQSDKASISEEESDLRSFKDSDDDETILDEEEASGSNAHIEEELDGLYKEKEMDLDQLLTSVHLSM